jgi:hypothetical protein
MSAYGAEACDFVYIHTHSTAYYYYYYYYYFFFFFFLPSNLLPGAADLNVIGKLNSCPIFLVFGKTRY